MRGGLIYAGTKMVHSTSGNTRSSKIQLSKALLLLDCNEQLKPGCRFHKKINEIQVSYEF